MSKYFRNVTQYAPKNGDWLVTLECGHEQIVRILGKRHVCYQCDRVAYEKAVFNCFWALQTHNSLVLVKGNMLKPLNQVVFADIERFPSKNHAILYANKLKITFQLLAVKIDLQTEQEVA